MPKNFYPSLESSSLNKLNATHKIPESPIHMVRIISLVTKEATENDLVTQCELQVKKTRVFGSEKD